MKTAKLSPKFSEPKATRQTVRGLGYMTVYGIFEATETRISDGLELGRPHRWGWVRSSRLAGRGYSLVAETVPGKWCTSISDYSDVVYLKPTDLAEFERREQMLVEETSARLAAEEKPEAPTTLAGYELTQTSDDAKVFVVRKDGRKVCEICAMASGKFQCISPWDYRSYETALDAIGSAR